jgi:hypothetical protein
MSPMFGAMPSTEFGSTGRHYLVFKDQKKPAYGFWFALSSQYL